MISEKYLVFFKNSFKSQITYRLATVMRLCSALVSLAIQISLWKVLIGTGMRQGTSLQEMITYVMVNAVVMELSRQNLANELGVEIRDGSIIMHLIRPLSFRLYLFSTMLGKNTYSLIMSALPVVLISYLFIGAALPPSVVYFFLFLILTVFGVCIMFQLIYITGLLAFWTQATWYLSFYLNAGVMFFGGTAIPLWFYPPFLQELSVVLPFRYITFEAIDYWLGKPPLSQAWRSVGVAALWAILLFGIGHILWLRVQKKLTVNGG
jgi:ABC-2 type transport system permease protein